MTEKAIVICDARAHGCHCGLVPNHEGFHECAEKFCGGAWIGDINGDDFMPIRFPGISFDMREIE